MKCLDSLKTADGIKALNNYLVDCSYIEGYQPTQADVQVFEAMSGSPSEDNAHARRWYKHISSYGPNERKKFAAMKKDLSAFGLSPSAAKANDDDDLDLFGSDEEVDEAAEKLRQERVQQYADKKSKKPGVIAKSSVVLDVKPWDDETDMKEMERVVRTIQCDGLVWGASKLVPLAYGIQKLQILAVVEDEKVSIDWLQEEIQAFEDFVQSVDIAAFQKI